MGSLDRRREPDRHDDVAPMGYPMDGCALALTAVPYGALDQNKMLISSGRIP